jgi:hypothetical protein
MDTHAMAKELNAKQTSRELGAYRSGGDVHVADVGRGAEKSARVTDAVHNEDVGRGAMLAHV